MSLGKLAFTAYAGAGPYPINGLDYLSTSHLSVTVNGTPASATFDDAKKTMLLAASPAAGAAIIVQRSTPRRQEDRLTQFLGLTTGQGGLSAGLLDQDARQTMLLMGEGRDVADGLSSLAGMGLDAGTLQWDGLSKKVENLLVASTPSSLVAKSQLDTAVAAVRNLPVVGGGDNDDGLFVTAGEFAKRTPAQSRTHLGLGTVATLTAGTGANNVCQLDSSARYPTADGRNIDIANHPLVLQRALATVVRWGGATAHHSPGIDPSVATWSQNSGSRAQTSVNWAARVELNNSSDVDGSSAAPRRISLSAGTWRIRWLFKVTMPLLNSATNLTSLRITNDDDTSAQVIYYDLGVHRPFVTFSHINHSMLPDELTLTLGAPSAIVFRYSNKFSGGTNECYLHILIQKIRS